MSENISDIIKREYIKCAQSPSYFFKKYCYIQHPVRGRILFNTYPFQDKVIERFKENSYSIVLKSRQLGISTLSAGYALWLMLFHKDKKILCLATKQDVAKNMVKITQFMYVNLPSWLKIKDDKGNEWKENNKLSLELLNGSIIKATSAASDAARSEAVSLLILDEAAFVEGIDQLWASAQQTLSTGGHAIVLSTPNGTGNWFHKTWLKAEDKKNNFYPIKLPWFVHPERDQKWRDEQDILLGDKVLAAQECDCDFATSGHTFFPQELIEFYEKTYIKEPKIRRGADEALWVWEEVDYGRSYMVTADVARGDSTDFSGFHVIDIESNTQVAEYKGQLGTREFGKLLVAVATEYNEALLAVENSNMGWDTVNTILEKGYRNFYFSPKNDVVDVESYYTSQNTENLVPGFKMTLKNRPLILNKFKEFFIDKSVVFYSKRLLDEIKTFIWKNGRPEAQYGYNDDLVIPFSIGMYLRDTSFRFKVQNEDLSRSLMNNIQVNKNINPVVYSNKNRIQNPYKMNIRGNDEDITWLFNK